MERKKDWIIRNQGLDVEAACSRRLQVVRPVVRDYRLLRIRRDPSELYG